jgi:serine/threonine protein kinase
MRKLGPQRFSQPIWESLFSWTWLKFFPQTTLLLNVGPILFCRVTTCTKDEIKLRCFIRALQEARTTKHLGYDATDTPHVNLRSIVNAAKQKLWWSVPQSDDLIGESFHFAAWGLARIWSSEMKRLTNKVITLWYRPPELLLGCIDYTTKIDMWSVGCIIAEMFRRSGFLKGANEATQLDLIFRTRGHATKENWPNIQKQCRLWKKFEPGPGEQRFPDRLAEALRAQLPHPKWMTDEAVNLISKLMELNPEKRWSALQALDADYFFEAPIVKPAKDLSMKFAVASVHEMDCRRKYEQKVAQHKAKIKAMAAANGKRNPHPPPPLPK